MLNNSGIVQHLNVSNNYFADKDAGALADAIKVIFKTVNILRSMKTSKLQENYTKFPTLIAG
jgi:hypothetical protein